jgi:hypothetical protein
MVLLMMFVLMSMEIKRAEVDYLFLKLGQPRSLILVRLVCQPGKRRES